MKININDNRFKVRGISPNEARRQQEFNNQFGTIESRVATITHSASPPPNEHKNKIQN